jgi:hypothetical protein
VKDIVPPHPIILVEVPGPKTKNEMIISDEASEELGDQIPQTLDGKEITSSIYPVRLSVVKGIELPQLIK